jgi:hypothetical protein
MRLPFADKEGFQRLPGTKAACIGFFLLDEIGPILENKEDKLRGTAARFLQVAETEIVQVIPISSQTVNIIFAEKEYDPYEYGDEDDE